MPACRRRMPRWPAAPEKPAVHRVRSPSRPRGPRDGHHRQLAAGDATLDQVVSARPCSVLETRLASFPALQPAHPRGQRAAIDNAAGGPANDEGTARGRRRLNRHQADPPPALLAPRGAAEPDRFSPVLFARVQLEVARVPRRCGRRPAVLTARTASTLRPRRRHTRWRREHRPGAWSTACALCIRPWPAPRDRARLSGCSSLACRCAHPERDGFTAPVAVAGTPPRRRRRQSPPLQTGPRPPSSPPARGSAARPKGAVAPPISWLGVELPWPRHPNRTPRILHDSPASLIERPIFAPCCRS